MRTWIVILVLLGVFSGTAVAEMEKLAVPCQTGVCFVWWPVLPKIKGWHHDRDQSLNYSVNAQAPDGQTFASAEAVIYAGAQYKPRVPKLNTLKAFIEADKQRFSSEGAEVREVEPVITADGQKLRSFTFKPKGSGNWEQVSYGEEGDYYLVFAISSRTNKGFAAALPDYKRFVNEYKSSP